MAHAATVAGDIQRRIQATGKEQDRQWISEETPMGVVSGKRTANGDAYTMQWKLDGKAISQRKLHMLLCAKVRELKLGE